jgi:hypothetical protein
VSAHLEPSEALTWLYARCEDAPARAVVSRLLMFAARTYEWPEASASLTFGRYRRELLSLGSRAARARVELESVMSAHASEIVQTFEALAAAPPKAERPSPWIEDSAPFAELCTHLRASYMTAVRAFQGTATMVVPLDARFAGFRMSLVGEKLLVAPESSGLRLPSLEASLLPKVQVMLRGATVDAVELLALRRLIAELERPTSPLGRDVHLLLSRPAWARVLADVQREASKSPEGKTRPVAFGFMLAKVGAKLGVSLMMRAQDENARGGRNARDAWRPFRMSALWEGTVRVSALERELGELLLTSGSGDPHDTFVDPLSVLGRATVSRLADHPHVYADPSGHTPFLVRSGLLGLVVSAAKQALVVSFVHGSVLLETHAVLRARRAKDDTHLVLFEDEQLRLLEIPSALRAWLRAASATPDAPLAFPLAASSDLLRTLMPALAAGAATAPESLLGRPVPLDLAPALAVDWSGSHERLRAEVELLVSVADAAPLVSPAAGEPLLHFLQDGIPTHVRRDAQLELSAVEPLHEAWSDWVEWDDQRSLTGFVEGDARLVRLLDLITHNPLGLRIETRRGKAPRLMPWSAVRSTLRAEHQDRWFSLKGELRAGDTSLPLSDLMLAIRRNLQYLRFGEDGYVLLTQELRDALAPLAYAAQAANSNVLRLHEGFVGVLRDALPQLEVAVDTDLEALEAKLHAPVKVELELEKGELRDYQRRGVAWMLGLAAWAPGCILADDMGLGKTVQTACVLRARAHLGPALVIAPASVSYNWKVELATFAPSLRVAWFHEDRDATRDGAQGYDVIIASYDMVRSNPAAFARADAPPWSTLVLDEVQYLKNHKAQRRRAIADLPRQFTVALSGTPFENHLGELWSVASLVFPGLLGTEGAFRARFQNPIEAPRLGEEGDGDVDARVATGVLSRMLRPFLLRRTRAEVLQELPPRQDITVYVELSKEERMRYETMRSALQEQFGKSSRGRGPRRPAGPQQIQVLAALTRLRQLACDAALLDPTFEGRSAKLTAFTELAQDLTRQGAYVLVFSQFTSLLRKAEACARECGARTLYLDGTVAVGARRKLVSAFQAGDAPFLFVSLTAGGTGLNLTRATHVVHLDAWWNPAASEQATSRAHRMGQTRAVTVVRLCTRDTLEERILRMHEKKLTLVSSVLEGKATGERLSIGELRALLTLARGESTGAEP